MNNLPPLLLASASPRRAQLLSAAGHQFTVIPAHAEESEAEHLTPREVAQLNAHRKARLIAKRHPDHLVLAADTVVCLGTQVFGKPGSLAEAEAMLAQLQGRTHEVITGLCLMHLRGHAERILADRTWVTFRLLDTAAIRNYLARINPLDKAGGYAIQEHGEMIVETIHGSRSNVIGLPMEQLEAALAAWPRRP
jgi:septum formation protein